MDIERLKYFLDLTVTLNFSETAERLFTTQSNISKHIIALEKELNTTLFNREHRKITLTKAGQALLPYAEKILSDYSSLQNALQPYKESKTTILKIGAIPVMVNYNVTGLIADFHKTYPDILLDVKEVESINLLTELNEGNCDIAYIRIFEMNNEKYEKITVEHDQFAVVLPVNHLLSKKNLISLAELKNDHFYQLGKHTQLFDQFYSLCQRAGFEPKVGYTGTRIDNILDFVSKGMGVSLMMQHSIKALKHPGIVVIPLDVTVNSELVFIRLKNQNPSPASISFWKFLTHKFNPKDLSDK